MKIGYARVSTHDQNLDLQKDALEKAGCEKIYVDEISGTVAKREGLEKAKEILRKGDVLIVWRLDRLGRSIRDLIDWINLLEEEGIGFKSLQESIDTTTSSGKLVFHIFAALAEFERNLIRERTNAGLAAARSRGKLGGRKKSLDTDEQKRAVEMYRRKNHTIGQICKMMNISKPTLYAYIREQEANQIAKA
ncbi:MAG: recombinase family protein [Acidobacteria bacterium]|nr:recombinase family protein [Acidobacteriota bacterium]